MVPGLTLLFPTLSSKNQRESTCRQDKNEVDGFWPPRLTMNGSGRGNLDLFELSAGGAGNGTNRFPEAAFQPETVNT
jgi:hypothetical protein